jgi:hypothetical protein
MIAIQQVDRYKLTIHAAHIGIEQKKKALSAGSFLFILFDAYLLFRIIFSIFNFFNIGGNQLTLIIIRKRKINGIADLQFCIT